MSNDNSNIARFNDIEYYYTVSLFNEQGDSLLVSQTAVKSLSVIEDVLTPYVDGTLVLDNSLDAFQRGYKNSKGETINAPFTFNKGDTDYVYVEIKPKFTEDQKPNALADTVWNLKYYFVVNEILDIPTDDPETKFKQLNLIDIYKSEKAGNIQSKFSTAKYSDSDVEPYLQDNEDRMIPTGLAIKKLLQEHIKKPKFDENFDESGNKIFYTSPIGASYTDDLLYLYNIHQSDENNDFCILSRQRSSEVWHLERFSDVVANALDQNDKPKSGKYQIEAFIVAEGAEDSAIPKSQRVPTDYGVNNNVSFGDYSKIENFRISEASKSDDNIQTIVAHSYDFDKGEFRIEYHDVNETADFYQKQYSEKMRVGAFKASNIFNIDSSASKYDNVSHMYASMHESDNSFEFASRNKILKSAYLLSVGIEFSIDGLTHRKSGRFFSVRKENNYVPSDYENKLQGQWYAVRVEHVFSESEYSNNIVGMKINKLEETSPT